MKVGEAISDEKMMLIAAERDIRLGVLKLNHPRCGRVEITRITKGIWTVTKCERPDKEREAP